MAAGSIWGDRRVVGRGRLVPPTPAFPLPPTVIGSIRTAFSEVLAPTLVPRGSIPGGVFGAFGMSRVGADEVSGVSTI